MRLDEVVDRAPPVELQGQVFSGMGSAPRATSQTSQRPAHGQIEPFNEGSLNPTRKASGDQGLAKGLGLAEQDLAADLGDAVAAVAFDNLGIDAKGGRGSTHQVRRRSLAAWTHDPKWAVSA